MTPIDGSFAGPTDPIRELDAVEPTTTDATTGADADLETAQPLSSRPRLFASDAFGTSAMMGRIQERLGNFADTVDQANEAVAASAFPAPSAETVQPLLLEFFGDGVGQSGRAVAAVVRAVKEILEFGTTKALVRLAAGQ